TAADSSGNGTIDTLDYLVWRAHYGEAYPEPPVEEEAGALATASRTGEEPIVLLGTLCGVRGPVFRPSQRQGITAPPNHHARDAALRLLAEPPARAAWPLAESEEMNAANQSQGLLESARGRVRGQSPDDAAFDLGFMIFDLW